MVLAVSNTGVVSITNLKPGDILQNITKLEYNLIGEEDIESAENAMASAAGTFLKDILNKNLYDVKFLTKELNRINASIGLYAIKGDMDYKNKYYSKVMDNTKFKIINNTYELVYYKSNTPILLTGCGSILNNDCDLGQTFSFNEIDNLFTISIIHEADIASTISSRYKPRLPLIGGLIKSNEGKNYLNSKYELGGSTLYVSGGIGTSDSGYRLFNHPSINFYRLVRKTK